jgi:hypothetical protein
MRNAAILCGLLLAVAGKGGLVYAQTKEPRARIIVRVELLVYSGRENPSWQLTDSESKRFFAMVERLPKQETAPVEESLGYSGVRVICFDDGHHKLRTITIFNSTVTIQEDKTNAELRDHGRKLEEWTVKTGRTKLDQELYQYVLRKLASGSAN